jgi:hypothetical protein
MRQTSADVESYSGYDPYAGEVMRAEVSQMLEKGTIDELVAAAEKNPMMAMPLRMAAAAKAQADGDVVRARKIASDSPDEYQRKYMLEKIERDEMWRAVNAEKLAAIQEKARQMLDDDERMGFLLGASYEIGARDPKANLPLLNQLNQMADALKPGRKQVQLKIGLAMLYCAAKNERGFAIMESLLPKFNELVTNAALLDGFETGYLRDGEWNMSWEGGVGEILNTLAHNAGFLPMRISIVRSSCRTSLSARSCG